MGYNHFNKSVKNYIGNRTPIYDAYVTFRLGTYNVNDKNHTSDVLDKGRRLLQNATIQEMIKKSPYNY